MISIDDLKQIHLYRQHLTDKANINTVCHDLNGIQAQFMVNVEHSLKIRCNEKIKKDSFGDGLVKNWTIRGTVHVFNQNDLPLYMHQSKKNPYMSHDWNTGVFNKQNCKINSDRLTYISRFLVDIVLNGITTREELKQKCFETGFSENEIAFVFDQWGGLLRPLCERGFLCYKVKEKKEFMVCPPFEPMDKKEAEHEHIIRYFTHFAPATVKDVAYYFGWTQTYAKEQMKKLPLSVVQINNKDYFYLGVLKNNYPDIPHCIFLAGFDQLMLGYQKFENIFLPQKYLRGIFNLAGIVMPSILLNGKVVGKWQKKKTKLKLTLFENIALKNKQAILQTTEELWEDIKKIEWT